ncbi:lytic transglycosylase domain-containing protein [Pokkaliibacter plantistimulans]|uniref:lytic transglycosylase domain-containing protein n=1 Tax=Pokkaliibacter plantistimulans TaxID=1635171 RepID=UPI000D740503|nr:lytic transglycosylase domain-containing protein [Pokkaliibacter plantistimulans]
MKFRTLLISLLLSSSPSWATGTDAEELYAFLFPEKAVTTHSGQQTLAPEAHSLSFGDDHHKQWSESEIESLRNAFKSYNKTQEVAATGYQSVQAGIPISSADYSDSEYKHLIDAAALKYGVDPVLVFRVIKKESNFNADAISPKGAKGLMQLMDSVSQTYNINPFDPAQNIDTGVSYLSQLIKKYRAVDLALAAYNAGPGAVDKYNGIPPYAETQDYVTSILGG